MGDPVRRSRRISSLPETNYYASEAALVGASDEEVKSVHFAALKHQLLDLGFESIYEAALFDAQTSEDICGFIDSGGLQRMWHTYRLFRSRPPAQTVEGICELATQQFKNEWNQIMSCSEFKSPINEADPTTVDQFRFQDIYDRMAALAPNLISLFNSLAGDRSNEADTPAKREEKRRKCLRRVVTVMCMLGNHASQKFTVLQNVFGIFTFASKASKRLTNVLNRIGLCPNYQTIINALNRNATEARRRLKNLCSDGKAAMVSFDNMSYTAEVRDQTLTNKAKFKIEACGYALKPHPDLAMDEFTREDVRAEKVKELRLSDMQPSQSDHSEVGKAMKFFLWESLRNFCIAHGNDIGPNPFEMPPVEQLDRTKRPDIFGLKTYPLNEGLVNEMIEILNRIRADTGLTEEQVQRIIMLFKGDLATVKQDRYSLFGPNAKG